MPLGWESNTKYTRTQQSQQSLRVEAKLEVGNPREPHPLYEILS